MLIDFVPTVNGVSLAEAPAFKKAPGGAPANVAVGVSRLGGSSAFIGKLGDDEFGHMLDDILKQNNVDNSGVRFDPYARTALAFVTLRADGEREFLFFRHPSADMLLKESELQIEGIMSIWNEADVIKISEEEIVFLTGGDDPNDDNVILKKLFHPNLTLLIVTEGSQGCRYYTKEFKGRVQGVKVKPVDTTGAGDAFVGGLLSSLASDSSILKDEKRLREALYFANACGAVTVTERGAIPALPTKEAVLKLIKQAA
ncbi:Probable fructokinase-6, chloroplastic [Linum perenne]